MAYTKNQMMQMLNIEAEANKLRKLKEEYAKSNNEKIVRSGYIIFSSPDPTMWKQRKYVINVRYEKNTLNWSLANIDNITENPLDCAMIFTDKEVAQYVCNDLYRHDGELDWFVEDVNSGFLFNANTVKDKLIQGIRDWFEKNGKGCNAVIGLSGGKDSTIVAKLCADALGPDRVYGVGIPDSKQGVNEADEIAKWMGIHYATVNIGQLTTGVYAQTNNIFGVQMSAQAEQNIPPRMRMLVLYAVSQTMNGRVIGTCNASENYIGYFTKYGDGASDFEPIAELTVHEIYQIGDALGIPRKWTYKTPDDGLPNSMPDDEKFEKMGFNYEKLDKYIHNGTSGDEVADAAIMKMHNNNMFKLKPVETIKF